MRGLNTRNSKLTDSYIKQFDEATVSSLLLSKAENVSSVLLDDFGHFLGRFLWNFAEQFFTSGNVKATDFNIVLSEQSTILTGPENRSLTSNAIS